MNKVKTKVKSTVNCYSKAVMVALCALLFAVCFMAVGLSAPSGQALANANANPDINGGGQSYNEPRLVEDEVSYKVDGGTTQNGTLAEAITAMNAGTRGTITLIQDTIIRTNPGQIEKNVTLDLSEYKLSFVQGSSNYINVISDAEFTLKGGTKGTVEVWLASEIIYNEGKTTVESGTLIGNRRAIYNSSSGTLNVTGGTLEHSGVSTNSDPYYCILNYGTVNISSMAKVSSSGDGAIYNENNGTINVNGGTVTATGETGKAIYNNKNGKINVSGGKVEATGANGYAIYNYAYMNPDGEVNITGGEVKALGVTSTSPISVNGAVIYNQFVGKVKIAGGSVTTSAASGTCVYNEADGIIEVSDGKLESTGINGIGIYKKGNGTVTVSGGTISTPTGRGIQNSSSDTGEVNITGGTFVMTSGYAINHYSGTLNISGGTITASTTGLGVRLGNTKFMMTGGTVSCNSGNGIQATENGTAEIQIQDASISTVSGRAISLEGTNKLTVLKGTSIQASGSGYGIYNYGRGTVTISGGEVTAVGGTDAAAGTETGAGIYNRSTGTININGGTVKATGTDGSAIFNEWSGPIIIGTQTTGGITTSGTVTGASTANNDRGIGIFNKSTGKVEVSGGEVSGYYGIQNYLDAAATGAINVTGGKVSTPSGRAIWTNNAVLNISGGTVEGGTGYGIFLFGSAAITVSGNATVSASAAAIYAHADSGGSITVSGGIVQSTGIGTALEARGANTVTVSDNGTVQNTSNGAAIYNGGTKTIITGGTITSKSLYTIDNKSPLYISGEPVITSESPYAILTSVAINGASEDGLVLYTGATNITINYSNALAGNPVVVYNNIDTGKFTLVTSNYMLVVSGNNLVLKAYFIVTFNYNNVIPIDSAVVVSGDRATKPATTLNGIGITGWYTDASYTTPYDFNTPVTAAITLYAKWDVTASELTDETRLYDGTDHTVTVTVEENTNYNYTYSWKFGGAEVSNTTTLTYKNVNQSGEYTFTVTAIPKSGGTAITTVKTVNITVNPILIDLPTIDNKVYNGDVQTSGTAATADYTVLLDEGGTAVGGYQVTLKLINSGNYAWADGTVGAEIVLSYNIVHTKAYSDFMDAHTQTKELTPGELTYAQYSGEVRAMATAYGELTEIDKQQFSSADKAKIEALKEKYNEILTAENAAKEALAKLGNTGAEAIEALRADGPVAYQNNVTAAAAPISAYTAQSGGLTAGDLSGYAVYQNAPTLLSNYTAKLAAANKGLAAINGKTAKGIKANDYTLAEVKALYATATQDYNAYYAAGGDSSAVHPNLLGYGNIASVGEEIAAYDAYKAFYDEYKTTWEAAANNKAKKKDVKAMESDYNTLSNKAKLLLDKPEQQLIADAIATYAVNDTAINVVMIVGNVLLALLIAGVVYLVMLKRKMQNPTQND